MKDCITQTMIGSSNLAKPAHDGVTFITGRILFLQSAPRPGVAKFGMEKKKRKMELIVVELKTLLEEESRVFIDVDERYMKSGCCFTFHHLMLLLEGFMTSSCRMWGVKNSSLLLDFIYDLRKKLPT
ncbi:hypothetical protein CEXT_261601 [Caerostris extrusa]|uniref:Uncharacterized protein n=1 Tax=Caerostris extrusa TaxID=172846 RepID=A0AAV4V1F1_CAEEX|nr:hypothetical protein CEXT_261601 [Caerostris extrusa]